MTAIKSAAEQGMTALSTLQDEISEEFNTVSGIFKTYDGNGNGNGNVTGTGKSSTVNSDSSGSGTTLLDELMESGKSEIVSAYSPAKGISPKFKTYFILFSALLELTEEATSLAENYERNKKAEKEKAVNNVISSFVKRCTAEGLDTSIKIDDTVKNVDSSFLFVNPTLFDSPFQNAKTGNVIYYSSTDSGNDKTALALDNLRNEYETVEWLPEASTAFVSRLSTVDSELQRICSKIALDAKECTLNAMYPLISLSTETDGGKVRNLRFSGNDKTDLENAVNNINGGKRL